MSNMLFSIVTPTFNSIEYIEECVQSVLNQTYPFIEHIFMDGQSTDGTLEKLLHYQSLFPSRILVVSEKDSGANDAWIKGMMKSKGDILGILGSDDTYEPKAVEIVADFFNNNPNAYFVFGGCNYIDANGKIIKQVVTRDFDLKTAINDMCSIPATSVFYKRNILDKVDPKIMMLEDTETEFWIEIAKFFEIHRIEPTLSNFRLFNNKNRSQNDMYSFAKTTYDIGRRHGAGVFSPCAKRYYLALATRPVQRIIDPIFHYMSTGDAERSNFLVKATRPFQPAMAAVYHLLVGSKKQKEPRK